jgi:predicted component of viral defense system (DUF524 family)
VDDIFRIETEQTHLSWSLRSESDAKPTSAAGRFVISPSNKAATNIKIWRQGVPDEAANDLALEVGPCLYEETFYNVHLRSLKEKTVELRHRDPTFLKGLHSTAGGSILHGSINFKSQIGRSRFSVCVDGKVEYDFEVEVFPTKLDYVADYNILLADVQNILTGLVLEYLRSTFNFGFASDSESSSRLEWILLLRHVVDDLERALHYIEQHPHHDLVRERMPTRVEKLRRPDAAMLKLIAQGKGHGGKSRTASGRVLHSRLPERRSQPTWDTPEHRWLAFQLTRIREALSEIYSAERKGRNNPHQRRILDEVADLENRLAALQNLGPFTEATGRAPAGFISLTLQAKPGYREAYRACLMLLQGIRVDGGPVGLALKDIHRLYEYWCYLALVQLIAKITGEKLPVRDLFSIEERGLRVRLKRGTSQTVRFSNGERTLELTYNPRYSGEAFLLPQKPDVVLTFRDPRWPIMRLVFDAKYRLETKPAYVKRFGSPGPPQETIDALHRYRDSILEQTGLHGPRSEKYKRTVVECVALFPYADLKDQFRDGELWSSLKRLGIGAIPFLPRETRYLEEWLRGVLSHGGLSTAERTIPYWALEQLRAWEEAEKETVLIGVLRPNATEHFEWIRLKRCYYAPYTPAQSKQLGSHWVAIYSPASTESSGAVTHVAAVEKVGLKRRSEIDTPWRPLRGPAETQVVYQLGEVRKLERPIENRGPQGLGQRFSQNRWTSKLAINLATDVRELFLETSKEWSLREQLLIAKVDFSLKPGRLQNINEAGGRTWFVRNNLRVRYRGAAGFLIRRIGRRDEYRSDLEEVVDRMAQA